MASAQRRSGVAVRRVGLDPELEFLPGSERDHPARGDGDLLAGLGVAAGPLVLLAELETAEARQLDLVPALERLAHDLEVGVHEILGFALVQADLLEQALGHLRFRYCHGWSLLLTWSLSSRVTAHPSRTARGHPRVAPQNHASTAQASAQFALQNVHDRAHIPGHFLLG